MTLFILHTSLLKDNRRTSFASSVGHCTAIHTKIWFSHSGQSQSISSFRKFKSGWTITMSPCEVVVHRVGSYNAAGQHGGTSKQNSLWRCCKLNLWDHWDRKWMTMYTYMPIQWRNLIWQYQYCMLWSKAEILQAWPLRPKYTVILG